MQSVEYPAPGLVRVGGDTFTYSVPPPRTNEYGTPPIYKSLELIRQLDALVTRLAPRRICELGIFRGGGVALLAAITRPERLVALDLDPTVQETLRDYLERSGQGDSVRPYYGIDQAHPDVERILADEFGDELLDLVIDDASHLYEPTRRSFEMVFPRIRPGGVYVIEDWAAQHTLLATMAEQITLRADDWKPMAEDLASAVDDLAPGLADRLRNESPTADEVWDAARAAGTASVARALSRLGLEIVHLAAESRDVVRTIQFTQGWIEITRGEGEINGPDWFERGSVDLFASLSYR